MKYARLFELAQKEWKHLSLATLFLFISSGLNLSFPLIIGRLIDGIDQGGGQEQSQVGKVEFIDVGVDKETILNSNYQAQTNAVLYKV